VSGDGRRGGRQGWSRGGWHQAAAPSLPGWVHDVRGEAFTPFDHHVQAALAAEHGGFDAVVLPYEPGGEESWVLASVLSRETRHVGLIAEFPLGAMTPVYAAKMAATYQRVSGHRLGWKLALDVDPAIARSQGDFLDVSVRYGRAQEFLTAARGVWAEQGYSFDGDHYHVYESGFPAPLSGHPFPRVVTSGTSPEALGLGARHGDLHLLPFDDALAGHRDALRQHAASHGRRVLIGLEVPVIAREDTEEAWARARRLFGQLPQAAEIGSPDHYRLDEHRWSGFGALGLATTIGLVGSYEEVAQRLGQLVAEGIDVVVLDGNPHVEEAYRMGEHLLPLLRGFPVSAVPSAR